jgi:hypothetical protein
MLNREIITFKSEYDKLMFLVDLNQRDRKHIDLSAGNTSQLIYTPREVSSSTVAQIMKLGRQKLLTTTSLILKDQK